MTLLTSGDQVHSILFLPSTIILIVAYVDPVKKSYNDFKYPVLHGSIPIATIAKYKSKPN